MEASINIEKIGMRRELNYTICIPPVTLQTESCLYDVKLLIYSLEESP